MGVGSQERICGEKGSFQNLMGILLRRRDVCDLILWGKSQIYPFILMLNGPKSILT